MRFPKLALFIALLSPVLLSPAYAQRGGGHGGGGGHFSGGGGHFGGSVHGGFSGGFRGAPYGGRYYGPSLYFGVGGLGYPYYGYGYGYNPYYYGYDPYAYGGYPAYSTPPPTGTQDYGYAYPQDQGQPAPPQQDAQSQPANGNGQGSGVFLIAFNDHTIQAATAYKVEGDQIHWIARDGQEKQAPLSSVDIPFSRQLNSDRHVDFQIP